MTWPHTPSDEGCPFIHDNIDTLYGVEPMPIDKLPKECVCGQAITYAQEVVFYHQVVVATPPAFVSITPITETADKEG